ncbi:MULTISPECIES: hypothetical protein [Streptomyces]|uniref:Uncharacterized protein n=1 Tax=Streptomyces bauhiniae TaxID=2340725 RepID=A0A4Z1CTY2_9ACTN|nr:hypothetical protein [Streptomyces bauhiniae]TGN72131.1 hypothetical protein E5083_31015 [Streptomyces bauhiniae]
MATTLKLPEAPFDGLRDYLMCLAADEDKTPVEELDGMSDSVLSAYWHGYVEASRSGRTGQELHIAAFGASLFAPLVAVCAETGDVRAALARSFQ